MNLSCSSIIQVFEALCANCSVNGGARGEMCKLGGHSTLNKRWQDKWVVLGGCSSVVERSLRM